MAHPVAKPDIMEIKPYIGGEGRFGGKETPIRLASNENPLGCSPLAREAYLAAASELHRYPDGAVSELRSALGAAYDLNPDNIVCGAGSDELISLIVRSYAGIGDEIVHSQYGFLMYPINAKAVGAKPVSVPEVNMKTDVEAVIRAVTGKTKIVILANPNNPTGSYLTRDEMKYLRDKLPEHVVLIIDAAYAEFATVPDYDDGAALVSSTPNTVMLRTFSKIYGLAALRLGWGYFPADIAGVINRVRSAFNVSVPAQAAGVAALKDREFLEQTVEMTVAGRSQLTKGLEKMGLRVYPSVTNFLLVEFGPRAEDIRLALRDKGIFIRQMGAYSLPQHLRITVGTERDNDRVLTEIRKIIS